MNDIDSSCTDDESEEGRSDISHKDQDSDVSFESDTLQRSKKRIGLNTSKGAPLQLWRRWKMRR